MDNASILRAQRKIVGMVRNVGYPAFQQMDKELDNYHKYFIDNAKSIDPSDPLAYFKYYRALNLFHGEIALRKLEKATDRNEFFGGPAWVNAWHRWDTNAMTVTAAVMNEPLYGYDFPKAVNYGALGMLIGHELGHGFDDKGSQYEWNGSLNRWMTPSTEDGFKRMARCVIDQYSGFCYPNYCLNGANKQGENIADNGGVKAAYRAYKAYTASHGEEETLPGLEAFSMDQIFFLSYAHFWCGSYTDEQLLRQLLVQDHSPGKERVIGALQNFPKFAEAFSCKQGDPMYPKSACDVW